MPVQKKRSGNLSSAPRITYLIKKKKFINVNQQQEMVSPRGVVVNTLFSNILVGEFEPQVCYYVLFQTNILGKGMDSFFFLTMG